SDTSTHSERSRAQAMRHDRHRYLSSLRNKLVINRHSRFSSIATLFVGSVLLGGCGGASDPSSESDSSMSAAADTIVDAPLLSTEEAQRWRSRFKRTPRTGGVQSEPPAPAPTVPDESTPAPSTP